MQKQVIKEQLRVRQHRARSLVSRDEVRLYRARSLVRQLRAEHGHHILPWSLIKHDFITNNTIYVNIIHL